jgi:hypothetical protein
VIIRARSSNFPLHFERLKGFHNLRIYEKCLRSTPIY